MNDSVLDRATDLVRLATTIRSGLESAERTIPAINEHLADLATLGITDFQMEGPTIYCRPAGVSSLHDDEFVIFQAALIMPGGIGAAIWGIPAPLAAVSGHQEPSTRHDSREKRLHPLEDDDLKTLKTKYPRQGSNL
jgi:hypothetical protein